MRPRGTAILKSAAREGTKRRGTLLAFMTMGGHSMGRLKPSCVKMEGVHY